MLAKTPAPAHPIADAAAAKAFIFGGNATFTLRSKKSGTRYTYRVRAPLDPVTGKRQEGPQRPYFAAVMYGPDNTSDFVYMGVVRGPELLATKKSTVTASDPRRASLAWFLRNLMLTEKGISDTVELWHEGKCGRCARKLTDPESLARGLGPECAGRA